MSFAGSTSIDDEVFAKRVSVSDDEPVAS